MKAKVVSGITASKGNLCSPPYIHFPIEITSGYSSEIVVTLLPPLTSIISTVAPNNPIYLGRLTLLEVRPLKLGKPEAKGRFDLKFEVDNEKIWKVENARKNADVCLQIRMEGLAFIEEKGRTAYSIESWSAIAEGMEARYNYIRIPVGDWISFLEDWEYGKRLLLDIPIEFEAIELRKQDLANRLKEAARGMERVQGELKKGEWITLIKDCRPLLDLLRPGVSKEIPTEDAVKRAIKEVVENSGLPQNYADGLGKVVSGLVTFVQPTHHIVEDKEIKIEPPYNKEEALFVMATISTLLNMLIKKLAKSQ